MKKTYTVCLLLLAVLLTGLPLLSVTGSAAVMPAGIVDSILPDALPRTTDRAGSVTDPAGGTSSRGGEEEGALPHKAEKGARNGSRDAAEEGAPAPLGENFSVGVAILVVGLAVISLVIAIVYVLRGKNQRQD